MTSAAPALRPVLAVKPVLALTAALAVAISGLVMLPTSPAHAAAGSFASSFETTDAAPKASDPYGTQTNVTGTSSAPGSLLGSVTTVTATAENAPGEVAANLADGSSSSKWLAFERTAGITYELDAPRRVDGYRLTAANDAPGRDPKDFQLLGSTDGTTWTALDSQTAQTFSARFAVNSYSVATPSDYRYYRLDITANAGEAITQLADWDIIDSQATQAPPSPMVTAVGAGPVSGYNITPKAGFTGLAALRYAGSPIGDGPVTAQNVLYDDLDLRIGKGTELSWKILPVLDDALTYSATYAAVDLVLDNGTRMSAANLLDGNGFGADARAQGTQKALYASQWNSVKVDLSPLSGRRITKILFAYDDPAGTAGHGFSGWLDNLRIGQKAATPSTDASSLVNWVDTRRGTLSSGGFSRGNNIPAAAVPNGFNFFTPMTNANSQGWLYDYASDNDAQNLPRLEALGISHEPSPWMGDRNQLAVLPSASATPTSTLADRALQFRHSDETARPDLYRVGFTNGMTAEVTPTDHGGVYRFGYTGNTGSVLLDKVVGDSGLTVAADGTVSGWVDGGSGLSAGRSRMFVAGAFDRAPPSVGSATGDRSVSARYAAFDTSGQKQVLLRIATSFISTAQAKKSLDLEVTGRGFDDVQRAAAKAWNDRLKVIEVQGATDAQRTTLYSSLYRLNLYPNSQFENTGSAAAPAYKYASPVAERTGQATATTTNAKIVDGKIYVNNGFWDTYRTVWPLYSLLYPKVEKELVDGFVQQYRDGGWVARWSSPGYADLMTGTSSDVAFADAYLNGSIDGRLALEAYDAALKNATVLSTDSAVGRKGLDTSTFLGYTPASTGESVSWGLEGNINDYGLGRMAAKLAADPATPKDRRAQLTEEASYFSERATSYVNLFDRDAGFFQARNADGTWHIPSADFDPESWGDAFTETDGWNFAFHAPFDVDGLAALYGGTDGLVSKLDEFFATPETATKPGGYGGVIHEMLEARDVRMGQLGMSNQPSHHIPYLYAAAGDPSKTQAVVREITQRLFVGSDIGQGYPGDEDNGEMSSWFVFSALGFYPEAVGSNRYVIGSPLFQKATVHLAGGRDLVIDAPNNTPRNVYIQSAKWNGARLSTASVSTTDLARGGTLRFDMGSRPSSWGDRDSDQGARVPLVDASKSGALGSSDGADVAVLTDDNSRSAATLTSTAPTLTWDSATGPVTVPTYTLTSGAFGSTPTAWTLQGSSDEKTWVTLDRRSGERFRWATQTRPFQVAQPGRGRDVADLTTPDGRGHGTRGGFAHYRLQITATSDGSAPTLAELELLADPTAPQGDFRLDAATDVSGTVDASVGAPLATLSGGRSTDAADYTATVDFQDGKGPQTATLTRSALGRWQVVAPHAFDAAGLYSVLVVVSEGQRQASATTTVTITRDRSLTGAFDTVCLASPGVAGNCDTLGAAFPTTELAKSGFVPGTTVAVPGTALTFDLPKVPAGTPDSATGRGQTIGVDLGAGATQLSIIGTATEKNLSRVGSVTFTDGTSADLPIAFGDWTGAASAPAFGNIVVATTPGRQSGGSGMDTAKAAIYSTAPWAIPAGKTVASITLPKEPGTPKPDGRIHVFAIASDGTRAAPSPLMVTSSPITEQQAGARFTAQLAVASGGSVSASSSATVNWGDGGPTTAGTVSATGAIGGTHSYADAGTYTVTVTVDDGVRSAVATTTVTVTVPAPAGPVLVLPTGPVRAGGFVQVSGSGFAAGELVTVSLATRPTVSSRVRADASGAIRTALLVPFWSPGGTYPVTATAASGTARGTIQVRALFSWFDTTRMNVASAG